MSALPINTIDTAAEMKVYFQDIWYSRFVTIQKHASSALLQSCMEKGILERFRTTLAIEAKEIEP